MIFQIVFNKKPADGGFFVLIHKGYSTIPKQKLLAQTLYQQGYLL